MGINVTVILALKAIFYRKNKNRVGEVTSSQTNFGLNFTARRSFFQYFLPEHTKYAHAKVGSHVRAQRTRAPVLSVCVRMAVCSRLSESSVYLFVAEVFMGWIETQKNPKYMPKFVQSSLKWHPKRRFIRRFVCL